VLLKIGARISSIMSTPIIPTNPSRPIKAKGKDADMSRQKGSELVAKNPLKRSILQANLHRVFKGQISSVAFSHDGARADRIRGQDSPPVGRATGRKIRSVAFSPDDARVLIGSDDMTARWDAATGQEIRVFRHEGPVWSVAFSPDGTRVLTGSEDKTARLGHIRNPKGQHLDIACAWLPDYDLLYQPP
jgi:hypothetical protein